jgi:transposase
MVSRRENISRTTITQWLARARRFGVTNLIHRPKKQTLKAKPHRRRRIVASPGRRIRLTPIQLWELSELLQQRAAISWADLLLAVEQRFGVTYSKRGIAHLVQKELGYRRVGRRLLRGPRQGLRKSLSRKR